MSNDVSDLRSTIVPKSDQLNADQLIGGPITITVTDVRLSGAADQPVVLHYVADNGRPYKPNLTFRKLLILAWGEDGRNWIGKSMTLYHEPTVRFGKDEVGGIRVSHLSDIPPKGIRATLAATKGKKTAFEIALLQQLDTAAPTPLAGVLEAIAKVKGQKGKASAEALIEALSFEEQIVATEALAARIAQLTATTET